MADAENSEVEVFFDEVGPNFQANVAGLTAMLEQHAEHGPDSFNTAQCHYVDQQERIYEHIKGRLRLFWFEDEDRVVLCTHGIVKKQQKTPRREIDKAIRIKKMYQRAKENGSIRFITEDDSDEKL